MALLKKPTATFEETPATQETPPFEAIEKAQATAEKATLTPPPAQAPAQMIKSMPAPAAAPKPAQALAPRPTPTALAMTNKAVRVIDNLKDQLQVEWNSLMRVQAAQGNFMVTDTEEILGSMIDMELMSWQENWVVSPNSKDADKKLVKYSDDGVHTKDGEDLQAYLAQLKAEGWEQAKISKRNVLVGSLLGAEKLDKYDGQLMQIDLAPTSVAKFKQYNIQTVYDLSKKKISEEQATQIRLSANVVKQSGNIYTVVSFNYIPTA